MGGSVVREGSRGDCGEGERGEACGGREESGCVCTRNDAEEISNAGSWTLGLRCDHGHGVGGSGQAKSRKTGSARPSGRLSGCHDGQTNHPGKASDLCFFLFFCIRESTEGFKGGMF